MNKPHVHPALDKNLDPDSHSSFMLVRFLSVLRPSYVTFFLGAYTWGSFGLPLVAAVCQSGLFKLYRRLSFQRRLGIGRRFLRNQPTETQDSSIHDRTADPLSEESEAEMDDAVVISDSEDEWMGDADEHEERQDSHMADDCAATGCSEARTPTFNLDIQLPVIASQRQALEPNEIGRRSPAPPAVRDSDKIPDTLTPYSGLGWVNETPKKLNPGSMMGKIGKPLMRGDQNIGLLYMRKHTRYNNVYKIGYTKKTMESREESSSSCVSVWTDDVHTTKRIWGAKRAEGLAKLYLAAWNVDLQICAHCDSGKGSSTSHTEWFVGDAEVIIRCLDFWVAFVDASYERNGGAFAGSTADILRRGVSSETPARGSTRPGNSVDRSPLAPHCGAGPAQKAYPDLEELYERANEAMVDLRSLLSAVQEPNGSHGFAAPERTDVSGTRLRTRSVGDRMCAHGASCQLCRNKSAPRARGRPVCRRF